MKLKSETRNLLLGACKQTGLTVLLCGVLLALCGAMILGGLIGQTGIRTAAWVCSAAAAFLGTLLGMRGQKGQILWTGLLGCGFYLLLVVLIGLALPVEGERSLLPVAIAALVAAAASCVLAGRKPRRSKAKRHRR